tara:strand:+ start:544 stop:870 length:327 start_codon:yes stop_codon:yes gene_type:complete
MVKKYKDPVFDCLYNTIEELGESSEKTFPEQILWSNADLILKSKDNVVIKFSITIDDYGKVEGKVGTFRIHEDGQIENLNLGDIFNKEFEEQITKLTEEGPPKDYLMN